MVNVVVRMATGYRGDQATKVEERPALRSTLGGMVGQVRARRDTSALPSQYTKSPNSLGTMPKSVGDSSPHRSIATQWSQAISDS
jgi:hypothetical protein